MITFLKKTRKMSAYRAGMAGEVLAAAYLRLKGYEVLASNYRYAHRDTLVFGVGA